MGIRLAPMSASEFLTLYDQRVDDYAENLVRLGDSKPQDSLEKSREELKRLLPQGQETPTHHFEKILSEPGGFRVGDVWFAVEDRPCGKEVFVYWLGIDEPHRRQGYATATLQWLEGVGRREGAHRLSLSVFGYNQEARSLYDRLGFAPMVISLAKSLTPE